MSSKPFIRPFRYTLISLLLITFLSQCKQPSVDVPVNPTPTRDDNMAMGKLSVPAALWKVIVVLPVGSDDVNRINVQTRVIAVWLPNTNAVGQQSWGNYRVSVDEVEKQTGYDLLSNLPESVHRIVKGNQYINRSVVC